MERILKPISGFLALILAFASLVAGIYCLINGIAENEQPRLIVWLGLFLLLLAVFLFKGSTIINPNQSAVCTFFGRYVGTVKENGLLFVNPLYKKQKISLRSNNFESAKLKVNDRVETFDCTVGEALLKPTAIYARAVRSVLGHYRVKGVVHGIAHITGGGLHENLSRILPASVGITIDRGSWAVPPVFGWLRELGDVAADEMDRVFNMGIGLVFVVSPYYAESIQQQLSACGYQSWVIGQAGPGEGEVAWS